MATKITVALEDDLDGGPADETRRFAIRGTAYEIDLNKKNARAVASNWRPSSSTPARPAGSRRAGSCPAGLRCNTGRVPSLSATTRRFSLAMGTLRRSAVEASPEAVDRTDASLAGIPARHQGRPVGSLALVSTGRTDRRIWRAKILGRSPRRPPHMHDERSV